MGAPRQGEGVGGKQEERTFLSAQGASEGSLQRRSVARLAGLDEAFGRLCGRQYSEGFPGGKQEAWATAWE